ncbi:MAG: flagellar hook-basal body complex protein FliE [Treponemataceae bacterium]
MINFIQNNGMTDSTSMQIGTFPQTVTKNASSKEENNTFSTQLFNAINSVNDLQLDSASLTQQVITDPESVEVHQVTTAMAKANLSLSLVQNVVDRVIKGWTEITTTR